MDLIWERFFIMNTINNSEVEVWKDVVGYEGLYQVSNLGRIRKIRKKNLYSKNKMCPLISNIMTPRFVTGGYLSVSLTKDGGKTKKSKGKKCTGQWLRHSSKIRGKRRQ